MNGRSSRRPPRARGSPGYTLIEVLLALALLAGVCAVVWPSLQKPLAAKRLSSAADSVRTEWCQARIEAMRSGHTYAFRYEVRGEHFRVTQDAKAGTPTPRTTTPEPRVTDSVEDGGAMPADMVAAPDDKVLPEGIRFSSGEPTDTAAAPADDPNGQFQTVLSDCWSDPIFFYPDGTTSDARLMLINDYSDAIELVLRGLTGTVTVADPNSSVE